MGGQACVLYGAAEFSRDVDFAILADSANLARLKLALAELEAGSVAVPPCELKYLRRGHGLHFRCRSPEVLDLRVDVMSKMRGVGAFDSLWKRRTRLSLPDGAVCDLMSLPDLVRAKKTQRDKDWPMIRRLVEVHYFDHRARATAKQTRFWLLELRSPELLLELATSHPDRCRRLTIQRPLLSLAIKRDVPRLEQALHEEEIAERIRDREYWLPLRRELEQLRHAR